MKSELQYISSMLKVYCSLWLYLDNPAGINNINILYFIYCLVSWWYSVSYVVGIFLCVSFSDEESMKDDISVKILDTAKESLLQGLSEENQGLQSVPTDLCNIICHWH